MKKIISFLLAGLIILTLFIPAFAERISGVNYAENINNAVVLSFSGSDKDIEVKSEINGKPVTKISSGAFKGAGMTSATLPESVTEIGDNAFASCKDLAYVTVGENVSKIGKNAFATGYGEGFILRCYKGSFADNYALENGINANYILKSPTLTAQALTNNSIHLRWKAVENADIYYIYRILGDESKVFLGKTDSTAFDVVSLTGNTKYSFYARAVSEDDTFSSDYSKAYVTEITTLCDNPEVSVTNLTHSIKLDWQDIDGAAKYRVYLIDGKKKKLLKETKKSAYTYNNLPIGKSFDFFVAIVDAEGNESKFSKNYVINSSTVCEQPNFEATASWISIDVKWKAVEGAKYYGVYYSSSAKSGYQLADYVYTKSDEYNYTIGGELSFTENYRVLVRAFNAEDEGSDFNDDSTQICKLKGFWVMLSGLCVVAVVLITLLVIFLIRRRNSYYEVSC